jgi:hypothetical protein
MESKMPLDQHNIVQGSGIVVNDFSTYCEGDTLPSLQKKIYRLTDGDRDYIVFVDEDFFVEWDLFSQNYGTLISCYGDISNKLRLLEAVARTSLRKPQIEALSALLSEALARVIGDKDEAKAIKALEMAESYLIARSSENARGWYLCGAATIALPAFLIACTLWLFRSYAVPYLSKDVFEVTLGTLLGGTGALFFVLKRTNKIEMDPTAGPYIHYIESAARVLVGNIGALLVAIALKANIIFGITKTMEYSLPLLLVFCMCAGASERFVSGIIKHIDRLDDREGKNVPNNRVHGSKKTLRDP